MSIVSDSSVAVCLYPQNKSTSEFSSLKIARYEIRLQAEEPAAVPAFAGSTLRGAFGQALKNTVCVTRHRNCESCLVSRQCIYPQVFETTQQYNAQQIDVPPPYTLDPPIHRRRKPLSDEPDAALGQWERYRELAKDDELVFGLMLMGKAISHLPYLVLAIHRMAEHGLGKGRGRFSLVEVTNIDASCKRTAIYQGETQRFLTDQSPLENLSNWMDARLAQLPAQESVKLKFVTPTRIKSDGDLQTQAPFDLLIRNIMRRVKLLLEFHGETNWEADYQAILAQARTVAMTEFRLRWWDMARYSQRQQSHLRIGGFVGYSQYAGESLQELLPLLVAGEILRIGKNTSFGLGKYEILMELSPQLE